MKALYIIMLVVGAILLLATEGSIQITLIGLGLASYSAYKLGLFDNNQNVKE